jgi:hypothetical protein
MFRGTFFEHYSLSYKVRAHEVGPEDANNRQKHRSHLELSWILEGKCFRRGG